MNDTKFKKALDHVQPDAYMESRMLENIKDNPVRKKRFPLKKVICAVLCAAVFASGATGIYYSSTFTNRPFAISVVYAEDSVDRFVLLEDEDLLLPAFSLSSSDSGHVTANNEAGFSVYAEDMESVQYKSKNGSFIYADQYKMLVDQLNGEYYSAVIPVSDGDAEIINENLKNDSTEDVLRAYISEHDVSSYFTGGIDDIGQYQVDFLNCADVVGYDDRSDYAFFLTDLSKIGDYYLTSGSLSPSEADSVTVQIYDIPKEVLEKSSDGDIIFNLKMGEVGYLPDKAFEALLDDPDMDKSKLPEDEITITVTFKDGKKARKVIGVSFNEKGEAQFAVK